MLNIFGSAFGSPSVPSCPTAEGGSGTSSFAIRRLPRKSARLGILGGGGGGNDGGGGGRLGALGWFAVGGGCGAFGIGGADGTGLEKPSELAAGGLKYAGASGSNPG